MARAKTMNVQEHLSRMHSLRHDVRALLHRAGEKELMEWQDLEPETLELDLGMGRDPHTALCESLERLIERLAKLHTAIS
ncbi:hypothetical protein [Pendulispora albinea]|uniref:Uncharacterized protein n=1 Tax=Pendulispora albinea TaxID=2741071 RepID=A0ABZ2M7I6_9BACT